MRYFAYGSNLSHEQMRRRCPAAKPLGKYVLRNAKLVFRCVADVVFEEGASVYGGLWEITDKCEAALDRFEGYDPEAPDAGRYSKQYVTMEDGAQLMFYTMNSRGIYPPADYYMRTIRRGYKDFDLPLPALKDAVRHAHDAKAPSHVERQRLRRQGRPSIAARPVERKPEPARAGKAKRHDKRKLKAEPPKAKLHDPYRTMPVEQRRRKIMNLADWLADRKYHGLPY